MVEFVVPEPAAQYVHLATTTVAQGEPVAPPALDFGPDDLTEANFVTLGRRYPATGLSRPPQLQKTVPATFAFAPAMASEEVNPTGDNPSMLAKQCHHRGGVHSGRIRGRHRGRFCRLRWRASTALSSSSSRPIKHNCPHTRLHCRLPSCGRDLPFYPYQWAGRHRWPELAARTSPDTLHQSFLQAGAARVVVPVREGFEHVVADYLRTGEIPKWGPEPWRGNPTKYPRVDELIADANDRPGGETAVHEPWEVQSPTTLIYLQQDAELNPAPA